MGQKSWTVMGFRECNTLSQSSTYNYMPLYWINCLEEDGEFNLVGQNLGKSGSLIFTFGTKGAPQIPADSLISSDLLSYCSLCYTNDVYFCLFTLLLLLQLMCFVIFMIFIWWCWQTKDTHQEISLEVICAIFLPCKSPTSGAFNVPLKVESLFFIDTDGNFTSLLYRSNSPLIKPQISYYLLLLTVEDSTHWGCH